MTVDTPRMPTGIELAHVLSHPVRHQLLLEYHRAETSPSRAAKRLGFPLNVASYHTNVLLDKHCIELVRSRRVRGATERFYRATGEPILDDAAWEGLPLRLRRAMTHRTLGMIWSEAGRAAVNGGFDDAHMHLSRTPLELDERATDELNRLLSAVLDDALRIQSESLARRPAATRAVSLVMLRYGQSSPPEARRADRGRRLGGERP